jgi:hypothetical protein
MMPDNYLALGIAALVGAVLGIGIRIWYRVSGREAAGWSLLNRRWERRLDVAFVILMILFWIMVTAVAVIGGVEHMVPNMVLALLLMFILVRQRKA